MTKTHVLANLNARLCRTNPKALEKIQQYCETAGFFLDESQSIEGLKSLVEDYSKKNITTLAIVGGDGTISRTLSELIRTYQQKNQPLPKIVILGGGTANVLANNLKVSGSPLRNIKKMAKNNNNIIGVRPLKINSEYGFLFADGCAVSYLKKFYANKGNLAAACWLVVRLSISGLVNGKTYKELVKIEDKKLVVSRSSFSVKSLVSFVSTIDKIPPGINFFKNNMKNTNTMHLLDFSMSPRSLVYRLFGIVVVRKKGIPLWANSWESDKISINNQKPWSYTIDGEVFEASEDKVDIHLGPEIEFLV